MPKAYIFRNLIHSKYNRLVWEDELDTKLGGDDLEKALNLNVGEETRISDLFILIERVADYD